MKTIRSKQEGSVLVIAILMITILTMICAVTLQITTQNAGASMQTASWQQALTGAEAGVDAAMNALNTNTAAGWTGWSSFAGAPGFTVPVASPTPAPSATDAPANGYFNYLPEASVRSLNLAGEGNNKVKMWVTVDTAGLPAIYGYQPYRIRATGTAYVPGPVRVSNQKMDNDLRNLSLRWDRATKTAITGLASNKPRVSRRLEVIARPGTKSIWGHGMLMKKSINMSGGGWIDSFDSTNPFKSSTISGHPGQYDVNKRQSNGDVATTDSTNSNLANTYVWGDVDYSGPVIPNTGHVQGNISTPFYATIPWPSDPVGLTVNQDYGSTLPAGLTAGPKGSPKVYKFTNLTIPGGKSLPITGTNQGTDNNYVIIWVTGNLTTSGTGYIQQGDSTQSDVNVTYYVDGDINVSGSSFNNQSGLAKNMNLIGVVPIDPTTQLPVGGHYNNFIVSGTGSFIGTVDAPGYNYNISGTSNFSGAFIGNTIVISGGASVHYDEALAGNANNQLAGTFAYVSWFEDTADPSHKWRGLDGQLYNTIY